MTWRYRFAFLVLTFLFLLVIFRLFYWQVVKAQELSLLGQEQYGTTVKIVPQRGNIETSDGFPIAANKISYQVFANPKEVTNINLTSAALSPILNVDTASISADLSLDKFWVPIKSGVDEETLKNIENLNLPGIGFNQQYQRFYPEASMAAGLLGFVGKDDQGMIKDILVWKDIMNRLLSGKEGTAVQVHDAFGRPIMASMNSVSQRQMDKI